MSRPLKIALIVLLLVLTSWVGFQMLSLPLWGWRPLVILASAWAILLLLLEAKYAPLTNNRGLLLLSSISGLLLIFAFPPSPLTILIFGALVPLLLVEEKIAKWRPTGARWQIFKYAFNTFLIWNIGTTWWILNTSFVPGIVAIITNTALMATVFMLFHIAKTVVSKKLRPWILPAFWIAFEWVHMQWEISWPWLTLGNTFARFPCWVQWYEYTGVFGGSLWILGVNYLLFLVVSEYLQSGKILKKRLGLTVAVIAAPIAISLIWYARYILPEETVEVAIVQPNFEPHYQKFSTPREIQLERFVRLSDSIVRPSTEYLVFPETSFGYIWWNTIEQDWRIAKLSEIAQRNPDLSIIAGVSAVREFNKNEDHPNTVRILPRTHDTIYIDIQNAAIQIENNKPIPSYFKSKLVPGAEIFPFRKFLPFLKPIIKMLGGTMEGHAKQEYRDVFQSDAGTAAPVICYESVYGDFVGGYIRKGADIIFIITNDGWWDQTPGHIQHLQLGVLRAIEHRRPIARSANTGISCFINARGDILQATEYEETTAILGKVAPGRKVTFYTRWGDLIARVAILLSLIFIAFSISQIWLRYTKKSTEHQNELMSK